MKNFKLTKNALAAVFFATALTVSFTSCEKDEDEEPTVVVNSGSTGNQIVSNNISTNTTWKTGEVYQLGGRIAVLDGVTLTIEKGVIVKGEAGTGPNATALLIARGGKLMAEGTATEPIIFTSVADEISPDDIASGNFASPNLDPSQNGLWGGLIVLGKATISASLNEVQIEGIPTSDPNGLYGGTNDADNSGVIKYVSIRHGGALIGQGNEINGLTLGGVGSGTQIDQIEIVGNQDDGIEWFGGAVNVSNVVVWNAGDDAIDTDQAWKGILDNFVILTPTGHCFELDGPEGSSHGSHTIKNGTVVASDTINGQLSEDLINVDANSEVSLENIQIRGIANGQMINRVTAPLVSFTNITIDVPAANLANYVNGTVPAGITTGSTGKANVSVFGWTWASKANKLSSL